MRQAIEAVRGAFGRRVLVCVVLAAFVAQGIVTQSHAHWGGLGQNLLASSLQVAGGAADPKQTPVKRGDANCPICHAVSIAGAFFAAASPILRLPSLSTIVLPRVERSVVVARFAAAWRSRAPPLV